METQQTTQEPTVIETRQEAWSDDTYYDLHATDYDSAKKIAAAHHLKHVTQYADGRWVAVSVYMIGD